MTQDVRFPITRPFRPVYQRGRTDCFRAALASVLGLDYADMPDALDPPQFTQAMYLDPQERTPEEAARAEGWAAWVGERGLGLYCQQDHPPVDRPLWIARVSEHEDAEAHHVVVFAGGNFLHDPLGGTPAEIVLG